MDLGRRALKENNRPPEEIDRLMAEKRRIMFDLYLATPPFAGVLEFLEFLNKIGMATAIVSSSPRGEIEAVLKKWGVEKRIQKIVAQGEVAHHKPHPEPYQKGATLLGLAPEKTLVVEDSPSGLASGKAAGCLCHVLLTSFSEDRLRGADRCFENFATLAAHLRKEWAKQ